MFPPLSDIKRRRQSLGITQARLAKISGISQDIISRIENGIIKEPSYNVVKRLFESLENAIMTASENRADLTAEAVMTSKIMSVRSSDYVDRAWDIMKRHEFSQIPVIDSGKLVGGISEIELTQVGSNESASKIRIEEIMSDAFPTVGKREKISTLRSMFESRAPAIIVMQRDNPIGIVTKSDLIDAVFKKQPELLR